MTLLSAEYANVISSSRKNIPEMVLLVGRDGRLLYASEQILSRLGYSSQLLLQKNISEIDPTFSIDSYFSVAQSECKALGSLFYGNNTEEIPVHLFITCEDILENKLLVVHVTEISVNNKCNTNGSKFTKQDTEEQNDLLRFLINEVPSPLVVKDYNGKFILTNKAVAELYGASTPESMIGKDDADYIPDKKLTDFFRENVRQIMDSGETQTVFEDSIDVKTGERRNFQSIKKPFLNKLNEKHILLVATDVTELKNIQLALEEQKGLFRQVINEFPSPFIVKDYDGKFVLTNKALANLYNVDDPDSMIGKDDRDYLPHLRHAKSFKHNVRAIMDKNETKVVYEDSFDVNTGERHHYMSIKKPFVNQKGEQQILVITNDITEMRKAEKTLMQYEKIMSVSHDFLAYVDLNYTYQAVNDTYLNAFQLCREEIIGKNATEIFDENFFINIVKPKFDQALLGKEVNYETWVNFPALGRCFIDVSYHPYFSSGSSEVEGIVVNLNNITERYEAQQKLRHMADHDILTGLPNRRLFSERLTLAIQRAQRHDRQVAVFFIDLDRFKVINDSLGHVIGDKVLQEISNRLLHHVRKSDTLARSGGDEFLLLLEDFNSPKNVVSVCENFLKELSQAILVEGHELFVTASIGVSIYPYDATNEKELIQSADTAMYQAKKMDRNTYQLSNEKLRLQMTERYFLEKNLRAALENDEFRLYFQPQIDMETKKIVGAEALLRWFHPEQGLIPPDKFIPVAEECGVIIPLGKWVLYEACRQMQSWQQEGYQLNSISVNASGNQLLQSNFTAMVKECLMITKLPPHFLELEVTESYFMNDTKDVVTQLQILRDFGVGVAIDDFGTSYSSLRYIQKLPISKLKIDRSFVNDVPADKGNSAIVKTIIDLANNLEISVIAEGVEEKEQEAFLLSQTCRLAQGFMYGKPVDGKTFCQHFLNKH